MAPGAAGPPAVMSALTDAVLDVLARVGRPPAVVAAPLWQSVSARQLHDAVRGFHAVIDDLRLGRDGSAWIGARDPVLMVVGVLGGLCTVSCTVVEVDDRPVEYDAAAAAMRPGVVVTDDPRSPLAVWARSRAVPVLPLESTALTSPILPTGGSRWLEDTQLRFFTSGTTASPRSVPVAPGQLLAALGWLGRRLELDDQDRSLSVVSLTHVLGLVTTTFAALLSGGGIAFGDLARPRLLGELVTTVRPTWCAASPSAHRMVLHAVRGAGLDWSSLRFLRTASAPLPAPLESDLRSFFDVPLISAYAMTEAPGEIASEGFAASDRRRGSVGRPTLCEVDIRSEDGSPAVDGPGEVWVRGPNVAADAPATGSGGWLATGDLGTLDQDGFLFLHGRVNELINQGGIKISPVEIESAVLDMQEVSLAAAFPIPHRTLGQVVGLAVVPRTGAVLEQVDIRRRLAERVSHRKQPAAIVICDRLPTNRRGKIVRRTLHSQLMDSC